MSRSQRWLSLFAAVAVGAGVSCGAFAQTAQAAATLPSQSVGVSGGVAVGDTPPVDHWTLTASLTGTLGGSLEEDEGELSSSGSVSANWSVSGDVVYGGNDESTTLTGAGSATEHTVETFDAGPGAGYCGVSSAETLDGSVTEASSATLQVVTGITSPPSDGSEHGQLRYAFYLPPPQIQGGEQTDTLVNTVTNPPRPGDAPCLPAENDPPTTGPFSFATDGCGPVACQGAVGTNDSTISHSYTYTDPDNNSPSGTWTYTFAYTITIDCGAGAAPAPQQAAATASPDATSSDVSLTESSEPITLLEPETFTTTVTAQACVTVRSYKLQWRLDSDTAWTTLTTQMTAATKFTYTVNPKVAGKIKVRVVVQTSAGKLTSDPVELSVRFPDWGDIFNNGSVAQMVTDAWTDTIKQANETNRVEECFYISLDTATGDYGKSATVINRVPNSEGGTCSPGDRPDDSPAQPTLIDEPTYWVGMFHTHSPTYYRVVGRNVGPSGVKDGPTGPTKDYLAAATAGVPSAVFDYIGNANGRIRPGWPLDAPARIYRITPPDRRTTP